MVEAEIDDALAAIDTYEADGAVWARTSAHGDDRDRVVIRSDGTPTYFAADAAYMRRKFAKGFDRLMYVLGRTTTATSPVSGRSPRCSAIDARRSRSHLPARPPHARRRGGEDVEAKRELSSSTSSSPRSDRRGAASSCCRATRPDDRDRVDLAAERSQKNPVYYVQYAHARIAGILRNAEGIEPTRSRRSSSPEERELVKRLLELPESSARQQRAARPTIPAYAIRVADDFHRFYHHHRVLGSDAGALARALRRHPGRGRVYLDLIGVDAPERM